MEHDKIAAKRRKKPNAASRNRIQNCPQIDAD